MVKVGALRRMLKGFGGELLVDVSDDTIEICKPVKGKRGEWTVLKEIRIDSDDQE